jgi:antitoxin MazE
LDKGQIILRPKSAPRSGWDQAFAQMHADGADALLLPENLDNDHLEEW